QTVVTALFVGDVIAGQIPEFFRKESEYRFAFGASKVLGNERFYMADMQRMPVWALMLNIVGAGVAGLGSTHEMCDLISKLSRAGAALTAGEALAKLGNGGLKQFATLQKEERAAVFASIAEVEKKEAALGAAALSEQEQQLKALKQRIVDE